MNLSVTLFSQRKCHITARSAALKVVFKSKKQVVGLKMCLCSKMFCNECLIYTILKGSKTVLLLMYRPFASTR